MRETPHPTPPPLTPLIFSLFVFNWTASNPICPTHSSETQAGISSSHFQGPSGAASRQINERSSAHDSLTKKPTPPMRERAHRQADLSIATHMETEAYFRGSERSCSGNAPERRKKGGRKKGGNGDQLLKELRVHTHCRCFSNCGQI